MFTIDDIISALPCEIIRRRVIDAPYVGASTNTKTILPNELYFAVRGKNADGHDYIDEVLSKGATGVVVSKDIGIRDHNIDIIKVPDTTEALQRIASVVRRGYNPEIVAITGSAGKTTTKEMVFSVLSSSFNTLKSPNSFNNHFGVPMTLLSLGDSHTHAVVEIGMNHPCEIAPLSRIVEPDIGIITNIGFAHIENLKSQEAIFQEKASLFKSIRSDGTAILNGDDLFLQPLIAELNAKGLKVISVGIEDGNDIVAENICQNADSISTEIVFRDKRIPLTLRLTGKHFLYSALLAIAAGVSCGISIEEAVKPLYEFNLPSGRLNLHKVNEYLSVVDDSYNASPDSVLSALQSLDQFSASRRIAVLGEMRELGTFTESLHRKIGQEAASIATHIIVSGDAGRFILEEAHSLGIKKENCWMSSSALEALEVVRNLISTSKEETAILVKGSRFTHMERVVLGLIGNTVNCQLAMCTLYINCKDCPKLSDAG